jgi:hypothetical protein
MSLERHVTEDERKLTGADVTSIRSVVGTGSEQRFRLLARLEALGLKPRTRPGASVLEIVDHWLLRCVPPLGRLGGNVVLMFHKPET